MVASQQKAIFQTLPKISQAKYFYKWKFVTTLINLNILSTVKFSPEIFHKLTYAHEKSKN